MQGLYLVPPNGPLIVKGHKHAIVKARPLPQIVGQDMVLVSGSKAYGTIHLADAQVVSLAEFDDRYPEHLITPRQRTRWWSDAKELSIYPIARFDPFPQPRPVMTPPGVQTFMEHVVFADQPDRTGVMLAFYPPTSDAALALALDAGLYPALKISPPSELHLTIADLGEMGDIGRRLTEIAAAVEPVARRYPPLQGVINGNGFFNASEDDGSGVMWASADVPLLPRYRADLMQALGRIGIKPASDHGFTPHITLAYVPPGVSEPRIEVPTTPWMFEELHLVAGDHHQTFEHQGEPMVAIKSWPQVIRYFHSAGLNVEPEFRQGAIASARWIVSAGEKALSVTSSGRFEALDEDQSCWQPVHHFLAVKSKTQEVLRMASKPDRVPMAVSGLAAGGMHMGPGARISRPGTEVIPIKLAVAKKAGNMAGLAKHLAKKIGGDPHFFSACMADGELADYDHDARAAICAVAHKKVVGKWPAEKPKGERAETTGSKALQLGPVYRGFKTLTATDGRDWLLTWTSNSFEDREGEIFTTKALEDYVARHVEDGVKGRFWFWHLPGTDFGDIQWQGTVGRFLVEAGPFDQGRKGRDFQSYFRRYADAHPVTAPDGWGCSQGYLYNPVDRMDGVYDWFEKKETSVLPLGAAANPYTQMEVIAMSLTPRQQQALKEIGGDELLREVETVGLRRTKDLEDKGIAYKEHDPLTAILEVSDSADLDPFSRGELVEISSILDGTKATVAKAPAAVPPDKKGEAIARLRGVAAKVGGSQGKRLGAAADALEGAGDGTATPAVPDEGSEEEEVAEPSAEEETTVEEEAESAAPPVKPKKGVNPFPSKKISAAPVKVAAKEIDPQLVTSMAGLLAEALQLGNLSDTLIALQQSVKQVGAQVQSLEDTLGVLDERIKAVETDDNTKLAEKSAAELPRFAWFRASQASETASRVKEVRLASQQAGGAGKPVPTAVAAIAARIAGNG